MATNTYVALTPSITLAYDTTTVTLSSIPSGYTDLRLVFVPASSDGTNGIRMRINGDTGSNYSITYLSGNGTSAISNRESSASQISLSYFGGITTSLGGNQVAIDFQNYSNTTTYKTALVRYNMASSSAEANVALWRSTSAITSLSFNINSFGSSTGDFIAGSTFSLYGIAAEGVSPAPLATGGAIYSDADYYYHAFGATGTFTPLSSLTADILVVGGGGGGGYDNGGGGGAGGIALYSSQSLTATGYSCTVGAGGGGSSSGGSKGSTGGTSTFAGLTAKVGGGGGGSNTSLAGATGASSGGGSGEASSGASGSATDGFAGAASNGTFTSNGTYNSGGGGGSAAAATQPGTATATGGSGGLGVSTYSTWLSATGLGKDGLIAGGGGGATLFNANTGSATGGVGSGGGGNGGAGNTATNFSNGTNGLYASGSGGGGGSRNIAGTFASGNGGSGVIIIRYLKA
jgi:hypothetical protein